MGASAQRRHAQRVAESRIVDWFGNGVGRRRSGGRRFALTKSQVRFAQAARANRETSVSELCKELGIKPVTLYRYVGPNGEIRENGSRVLAA